MCDISIIIPIHNVVNYVKHSVDSAQKQTGVSIEIICIDDGSTDGSGAILDELAAKDERIKVVHQSNMGASAARNKGIELSEGKYLQFLDGDDELELGISAKMFVKAEADDCDIVQCGHCEVKDGEVSRTSLPNTKCEADSLQACPEILHLQTKYIWDKLFRKAMLDAHGIRFAPYGYHEDHLFLFNVDLVAHRFATIQEIGYRYSKTSAGAATRAYDERLLDCTKAYVDICNGARAVNMWESLAPSIWRNCSQSYAWRVLAFPKYDNKALQDRIVGDWATFFDENFPDWQKRMHLEGLPVALPEGHPTKVLLLGGTGALGAHLRELLAEKGYEVWVTSRSEHEDSNHVHYIMGNAMERPFFDKLMKSSWDAIVDFMVHGPVGFEQRLPVMLAHTKQYVFLSSSRVYANHDDKAITEESARILDTTHDEAYLATNEYALAKGRAENLLKRSGSNNWTVVRPYITFSEERLQLGTLEKESWLARALAGKPIVFSEDIASKTTTLTYGRDVARGMAELVGNPKAFGQTYHITSPKQVLWRDVLNLYVRVIEEVTGRSCPVVMTRHACQLQTNGRYQVLFDRLYNRKFDNAKIGEFIDVNTFRDPTEALEDCLRTFLKAPRFLAVNEQLDTLHDAACTPKAQSKAMYTNERNVQILIAALKGHGINQVIASPGTTNLTFVASVQHDPFFTVRSAPDERSAAYMACGWSAESGKPVVISCTGATASRNYLPGLTEAYYRKLPVLAVTGTLYESRSGHLTAQFVDRSSVPTDVVNLHVSMPLVRANDDVWRNTVAANRAILELSRRGGGPVHINLETGHSHDYSVKELPAVRLIQRFFPRKPLPAIPDGRVAVFVGTHKPFSPEQTKAIEAFCEHYDAPVFCDHSSNYRGDHELNFALACYQQSGSCASYQPKTLIHIGEVSGDYPSMKIVGGARVWRVSPDGEIRDTFRCLTNVFEMEEQTFFTHYASVSAQPREGYFRSCSMHLKELHSRVPELPFSNLWVASKGCQTIPDGSILHFGILNSFRSWSLFPLARSIVTSCNTGGFGIDGCLSTLLGASFSSPERPHFAVLGDLAFFYDMNSLGNRHVGRNLRILLINNGKGVEFRNFNHPASQFGDTADEFVAAGGHYGNKSHDLVRHYAQDLGFKYLTASSKKEYEAVARDFWVEKSDRPVIFEVFVDSVSDSNALEAMTLLEGGPVAVKAPSTPDKRPLPTKPKPSSKVAEAPVPPKSRRIAILTFHTAFNCGAHLQAWALQTVLKRLGFEPEFPDCTQIGFSKRFTMARHKIDRSGFKTKCLGYLEAIRKEWGALGVEDVKRYRFRMFAKHCLRIVPRTVQEVDRVYEAVIVGSDQVWNSGITRKETSYYTTVALKNPRLRRYSYGISFGDTVPKPERIPSLTDAARKFENLSVRENLLPQLMDRYGKHPVVDPDPTLLLSNKDFAAAAYPKRIVKKPYLLVYSLMYDAELWKTARTIAERHGLKPVIILVYQYGNYLLKDGKGVDIAVSPDRFLAYVRDAEMVLTSSFHGTVFSIIYEKRFAVFTNYSGKIPVRCERLLKSLHEQSHLVPETSDLDAVEAALLEKPRPETYRALEKLRNLTIRRFKTILPDVSKLPRTKAKPRYSLLTWPFHKIWGGIKCLSDNGITYTVKHAWGKVLRFAGVRSRL